MLLLARLKKYIFVIIRDVEFSANFRNKTEAGAVHLFRILYITNKHSNNKPKIFIQAKV